VTNPDPSAIAAVENQQYARDLREKLPLVLPYLNRRSRKTKEQHMSLGRSDSARWFHGWRLDRNWSQEEVARTFAMRDSRCIRRLSRRSSAGATRCAVAEASSAIGAVFDMPVMAVFELSLRTTLRGGPAKANRRPCAKAELLERARVLSDRARKQLYSAAEDHAYFLGEIESCAGDERRKSGEGSSRWFRSVIAQRVGIVGTKNIRAPTGMSRRCRAPNRQGSPHPGYVAAACTAWTFRLRRGCSRPTILHAAAAITLLNHRELPRRARSSPAQASLSRRGSRRGPPRAEVSCSSGLRFRQFAGAFVVLCFSRRGVVGLPLDHHGASCGSDNSNTAMTGMSKDRPDCRSLGDAQRSRPALDLRDSRLMHLESLMAKFLGHLSWDQLRSNRQPRTTSPNRFSQDSCVALACEIGD